MKLDGKVCVITGGGSGIGRAAVELFLKEGATVVACDIDRESLRRLEDELSSYGDRLLVREVDVRDFESVEKVVDEIFERFGRIDVLVNNAGVTRDALLEKMTEEDWDFVVDVNLKGVFNMTRAVYPYMLERGEGSVINTSSIVGVFGNIGQTNYAASKAGIIGMTKTWAKEFARKGANIRVNAVAPGFIMTPMVEKVPEKILEKFRERIPLKRFGKPEEVARLYLFLASDDSSYITGQVIGIDGGLVL